MTLRAEIKALTDSMAEANIYATQFTGMGSIVRPEWQRFEQLKGLATNQEMRHLLAHPNPVVRCYAFEGLLARNDQSSFEILLDRLSDGTEFRSTIGCISGSQSVAEFCLDKFVEQPIDSNSYRPSVAELLHLMDLFGSNEVKILGERLPFYDARIFGKLASRRRWAWEIGDFPEFGTVSSAQLQWKLRPELRLIVDSLANEGAYYKGGANYGGVLNPQYMRFLRFHALTTREEIWQLLIHPEPIVRVFAFQSIVKRNDPEAFAALLSRLHDCAEMKEIWTCMPSSISVADACYRYFMEDWQDGGRYKPNGAQLDALEYVLMFDDHAAPDGLASLFWEQKPRMIFHERLRAIVRSKECGPSCMALARYRDPDDVPIIGKVLRKAEYKYHPILAVRIFPHRGFLPELVQLFEEKWKEEEFDFRNWSLIYNALLLYDGPVVEELFQRTVHATSGFHKKELQVYLVAAVRKSKNPNWKYLEQRIVLDSVQSEELNMVMHDPTPW